MPYIHSGVICLVLVLFTASNAQKFNCSKKGNLEVDSKASKLFMMGEEVRRYPTNEAELNEYCKTNQNYENYIRRYSSKCFTGLTRQVTGLYMYSVIKTNKRYCNGRRRQEFLSWTKCGNDAKLGTAKCMKRTVAEQSDIINHDNKLKIPLYCCTVYGFKSCAAKEYRKAECSQTAMDGWKHIVDKYTVEVTRLLCGDYTEGSDNCKNLLKDNPLTPRKNEHFTPLNTIVDVLYSMDE